ncbi:hypothetical protein L208DRAFT_1237100 [Tricholoma matsutake]|nr:hypothetical protein L208DRAFT_1237100 [Tricholoma matsutake 945]
MTPIFVSLALYLLAWPSLSAAWIWTFQNTPQQCKNLTIAITGSNGLPPYRALIVPTGPSPLPNNVEVRRILDVPFVGNSTSVSFQLRYPANSQFVAVISDSTGFGSGGTSVSAQVTTSTDGSCFDATQNIHPDFVFSIEPPNQLVQCQPMRIWWDPNTVEGTPNFLGIIPGGQSFSIPEASITNVPSQGTGFGWTPSLRGGTTLIILGGDNRGNGTAGSSLGTVSSGPSNNGTCLSSSSPSSTPGSPAGGSYPTGTSSAGGGGTSSNNTGAIVGGIVGGLAFLACLAIVFFFYRRHKQDKSKVHARPNLFTGDEGDDDDEPQMSGARVDGRQSAVSRRNELPEYYQPEPFNVPDPMLAAHTDDDGRTSDGRPLSGYTSMSRSETPDLLGFGLGSAGVGSSTSSGGRKGPIRQMRPVNVIQHDDAGPNENAPLSEEPETVELPPAYTNIRK